MNARCLIKMEIEMAYSYVFNNVKGYADCLSQCLHIQFLKETTK